MPEISGWDWQSLMTILVFNAGSSSLKFGVFGMTGKAPASTVGEVLLRGKFDHIGTAQAAMTFTKGQGSETARKLKSETIAEAGEAVLDLVSDIPLDGVGHRIVHGGGRFYEPTLIDSPVLKAIHELTELAPLHNPSGLAGIQVARHKVSHVPNVAIFDTAFHHNLPAVAAAYALPNPLTKSLGLRRFGFHGISYSFVSKRLQALVDMGSTRHIICHLGNGASVCALLDGQSIDTSMGFTPLEGLIMGTRSGDVDPGLILHLQRVKGMTTEEIDDLLNHKSGMLGLSGHSGDVRDLEKSTDKAAAFALECFCYRVCKYIGSYAAALGGVDALVFTGGIGEFSSGVRAQVCRNLGFLNLIVDEKLNGQASGREAVQIGAGGNQIWVIPTDEEQEIAIQSANLLDKPHQALS